MLPAPYRLLSTRPLRRLVVGWVLAGGLLIRPGAPTAAQTCPDPAADPIVNETFGRVGAAPSLAGRTTCQPATTTCPLNGEYSIRDTVDGTCYNNLWHTIRQDHTPGDGRGNFLLINTKPGGGEFFSQPAGGLCPGTTYEFSVWAVNLLRPGICTQSVVPRLVLRVETAGGQLLQSLNAGDLPMTTTVTWFRYAVSFTTPETADAVVLRLGNDNGDDGCGNDLAIDDLQLRQCGACLPPLVYIPDAFSPNHDGINDELAVFLREPDRFDLKIYNRWGNPIFVSTSAGHRWDGTDAGAPCPAGTYTWVLTYQNTDATHTERQYVRTGRVLLIR